MEAKNKWNEKHKDKLRGYPDLQPNERLIKVAPYLNGKKAMDLACGLGANSVYLASLGYEVTSIDVSDVAIDHLLNLVEESQLPIDAKVIDLTDHKSFVLAENDFDLCIMTYYLNREVLPEVKKRIRQSGYFFMETFYNSEKISKKFQLDSNELLNLFKDWKILFYEESEMEGRQTIFCRKVC